MALIRLRGSCEDGNTCPTLIYDTTTGAVGVQAHRDPDATARLTVSGRGGLHRLVAPPPGAPPLGLTKGPN